MGIGNSRRARDYGREGKRKERRGRRRDSNYLFIRGTDRELETRQEICLLWWEVVGLVS